jgi:hypothetical protein
MCKAQGQNCIQQVPGYLNKEGNLFKKTIGDEMNEQILSTLSGYSNK